MWRVLPTEEFARRAKKFEKKHRAELTAMLDNLDTYLQTLQSGVKPMQIKHGFMHAETHGAIAVDQRGAPGKPTQTRLYIYPDTDTFILHVITIGDKNTQRDDNATCREFIVGLREEKTYGQEETSTEFSRARKTKDESDPDSEAR